MKGRGMNGSSFYDYDVSGKISMKAMYERSKIDFKDIKIFLGEIKRVVAEVENHLLNIHCILLKPEYIFYENGCFYFCYYPLAENDFWEEFHHLSEYFVKYADYEDEECVRITFLLHKETMEENYSLEKIIEECLQGKEEEKLPQISYDTIQHDWIAEQKSSASIMRETDNMWKPVKRFLNKHKRGYYVEAEF